MYWGFLVGINVLPMDSWINCPKSLGSWSSLGGTPKRLLFAGSNKLDGSGSHVAYCFIYIYIHTLISDWVYLLYLKAVKLGVPSFSAFPFCGILFLSLDGHPFMTTSVLWEFVTPAKILATIAAPVHWPLLDTIGCFLYASLLSVPCSYSLFGYCGGEPKQNTQQTTKKKANMSGAHLLKHFPHVFCFLCPHPLHYPKHISRFLQHWHTFWMMMG